MVELLICNQQVGGSSPSGGSKLLIEMNGKSPEDHLDYMFTLDKEVLEQVQNPNTPYVCEWDNIHGDSTHFR